MLNLENKMEVVLKWVFLCWPGANDKQPSIVTNTIIRILLISLKNINILLIQFKLHLLHMF